MKIYIIWQADYMRGQVESAIMTRHVSGLRKVTQDLARTNDVFKSWALASGGSPILFMGDLGVIDVEADALPKLPDIRRQFEELTNATLSIGVGMELDEANKALKVAQKRGGDQIQLYVPDMDAELNESEPVTKAEATPKATPQEPGPQEPQQTADANPSGGPDAGAPPAPKADDGAPPQQGGAPPKPSGDGDSDDSDGGGDQQPTDPKTAIMQALKDIKANGDALQKLKETNPEAFKAVVETVNAMILMAQGMMDDTQKSEESSEESSSEESSELEKLELGKLPQPQSGMPKKVHHDYPVGSEREGKVKVGHLDPATGQATGTSWNSVRDGQVQSKDGHPISSRNQNGK